jgi:hypothetical protein
MQDSILTVWLRFLALHIAEPVAPGTLADEIRSRWLLASSGNFTGCIPEGLAESIATIEGETIVRTAISKLMSALTSLPFSLSNETLNLLGIDGVRFSDDCAIISDLTEVGVAYLALIDGMIKTRAEDTTFVPRSYSGAQ